MNLDISKEVFLAVAERDGVEFFPRASVFKDREPRPCHKVDTFRSYTNPKVVETHPFHSTPKRWYLYLVGSTCDQMKVVANFHFFRLGPRRDGFPAGANAYRDPGVGLTEFLS